ncbi:MULTISPECIES: UbiD family decarboxylase [Methanoculleus]|uniref:Anhydromevalonate phosphate decarboxylase n=1 Tax=Methanoculleus thermophilus TaxID=2200 RepID=A0A1G8X2V8_9EURY|nr:MULTISPECIES: UbiD family decarboxylase [Methanoculleus]NLN09083.1 UbiD family decarboxylase [Methanoculleus thermophilus]SDJ84165.1 UbiD family decarboxylase [Methanoculleus thermophilus]HQD26739.1 UbiD family decarboxylase [Methanoculleus thermophilus]
MRNFIERMRELGRVEEIERPCSTVYEAPRMASRTDKILFFHDLDGHRAVMNLLSSRGALAAALGVEEKDLVRHLAAMTYSGRVVDDGRLEGGVPADLSRLPIMKHFPGDAGRYITSGIVFSRYNGVENASIHRMMVLDDHRVVARLVEGRHTHTLLKAALARGEKLPVAVTIGTHPLVTFAACTRVPEGKEFAYAAELMGGELALRECENGVRVPDAEIVLEGYITAEMAPEGPFVDITGTYDPVRQQHIIEFEKMYCKEDPIYHGILPAGDEHKLLMGAPYEPKIYRAVAEVTTVRDVLLTKGGAGYLHAVIQIRKNTQGDAKNAIMAAFAAHTSLKHVVVVDEDIDIHDPHDVEYAIATRVRGDTDIMIVTGVRGSSLDPTRLADGTNVKVGVDATMVMGREDEFKRAEWP